MSNECLAILSAAIGVAGTVIGTLIGFILGKLRFGKLHLYFANIEKIEDGFEYQGKWNEPDSPQKLRSLKIKMDLRIYNSSEKDDVIYDCEIALIKNKEIIQVQKIIDPSTIVHSPTISTADNITAYNISAKCAVNIPIDISFGKIDEILKSEKIILMYRDRNFKQKNKTIQKVDFSNQPVIEEDTLNV